jgi:cytochrome b subunit of formate dehydrogenase
MAETTYLPSILEATGQDTARFSLLVRVTHWLNTVSFIALVVSGFGILLAHPRFYWGETGGLGTPSIWICRCRLCWAGRQAGDGIGISRRRGCAC